MSIIGKAQFERIVYRNIMVEGVKKFVSKVTDINESARTYDFVSKLVESHFDDKFIDPKKTVSEISESFAKAAYHFQKLSNLAESTALTKSRFLMESKVALQKELCELTAEEQEAVDAVTEDIPENLVDAVAEKVAAALAADRARTEQLMRSNDIMQKAGDSPEVIEKAIQEASMYPVSLLDSIVKFQARQHMRIGFNEGHKDFDAIISANAKTIEEDAITVYSVHECFNVGLKAYTVIEAKELSNSYFRA